MNKPCFSLAKISTTLVGKCRLKTPRDEWLIDRTREWAMHYCVGKWRYSIDQTLETLTMEFELLSDADEFRRASAKGSDLIKCV